MAEATVAIGTTLIGIALMIAFYAKAPQRPLTENNAILETTTGTNMDPNQLLSMLQQYDTDLRQSLRDAVDASTKQEVDPYVAKLVAQSTALQLRLDEAAKEKLTDATDKQKLVDDIKSFVATQEALQKAIAEMKVNADANDVKVHSTIVINEQLKVRMSDLQTEIDALKNLSGVDMDIISELTSKIDNISKLNLEDTKYAVSVLENDVRSIKSDIGGLALGQMDAKVSSIEQSKNIDTLRSDVNVLQTSMPTIVKFDELSRNVQTLMEMDLQNIDGKMASVVDNLRTEAIDLLDDVKRDVLAMKNDIDIMKHDTTNADVIANLGSKVASLLNLDLDAVDSRLTANMKELKDQLDSIHKTKSVEIDKLSQDVQALRAMNLQNIDGRMTQAIAALRTELKADTVEQLSSIKNDILSIQNNSEHDDEIANIKSRIDTLDGFNLGSIDSRLATMIEDTKQELVKAINSVTSEQKDIRSVIQDLLNKGADKDTIATLNDKVLELEKANLNDANGTKISELKSELKDDIERVKSSLLVTISESIDARTSKMFATISQDVQALRAMNLQNIDGRMTQAISALRTELEADTVEQLSSIKNDILSIQNNSEHDDEIANIKSRIDTLDGFDLGSIDSRLATMIEDTKQELVKAINSVTSEQKDIRSVIQDLLNKGADKDTIATLNDKVLELEKANLDDANGTKISELKSELKDDIERVKSSLLVTISESIDARTSKMFATISESIRTSGINKDVIDNLLAAQRRIVDRLNGVDKMNEDRREARVRELEAVEKLIETSIKKSGDESQAIMMSELAKRNSDIVDLRSVVNSNQEENLKKINDLMMHFNKVSDHLSNMKTLTPEQADDRISIEFRKLQKQIDDFTLSSKITLNSKIDTLYKDIEVLNINTNNANSVIGGLQSKIESIITEMSEIHRVDPTTIADINAKVEIIEARIATLKTSNTGILDRLTTLEAIVSKLKDRNDDQQKQISSLQAQRPWDADIKNMNTIVLQIREDIQHVQTLGSIDKDAVDRLIAEISHRQNKLQIDLDTTVVELSTANKRIDVLEKRFDYIQTLIGQHNSAIEVLKKSSDENMNVHTELNRMISELTASQGKINDAIGKHLTEDVINQLESDQLAMRSDLQAVREYIDYMKDNERSEMLKMAGKKAASFMEYVKKYLIHSVKDDSRDRFIGNDSGKRSVLESLTTWPDKNVYLQAPGTDLGIVRFIFRYLASSQSNKLNKSFIINFTEPHAFASFTTLVKNLEKGALFLAKSGMAFDSEYTKDDWSKFINESDYTSEEYPHIKHHGGNAGSIAQLSLLCVTVFVSFLGGIA